MELLRRRAQRDLLAFLQWVWWMPRPLRVGRHTRALCARLTKAVDDWLEGKPTYLIVNMPFRHGKSDLVSRALPAYFLGRCAAQQPDMIMSGYGTSLVKGFSKKVQAILRSEPYQKLFPSVRPDPTFHAAEEWHVEGSSGTVVAQGLGGSITGKGGNLIIVDDYCKNREEAESKTIREKMWESFKDDLMTRANAPAALVIVCATRWHVDDIVGRIYESMKKDPDYPRFESLIFPARKEGEDGWDILFPELYDEGWYMRQRASLGSYSAAALLDCNPVGDEMRVFRDDWFACYEGEAKWQGMNVYMFVDSANSKKQNADYTTMWVIGMAQDQNYYVLDCVHDRLNLRERTDAIFRLQRRWRPLQTFWEQVGCMSDIAHIRLEQDRIGWHFGIRELRHTISKDTRIRSLQPLFEAHRIWFPQKLERYRADGSLHDIVREFLEDEYQVYPGAKHDDMIDCLADIMDEDVIMATQFPQQWNAGEAASDYSADVRKSLFSR